MQDVRDIFYNSKLWTEVKKTTRALFIGNNVDGASWKVHHLVNNLGDVIAPRHQFKQKLSSDFVSNIVQFPTRGGEIRWTISEEERVDYTRFANNKKWPTTLSLRDFFLTIHTKKIPTGRDNGWYTMSGLAGEIAPGETTAGARLRNTDTISFNWKYRKTKGSSYKFNEITVYDVATTPVSQMVTFTTISLYGTMDRNRRFVTTINMSNLVNDTEGFNPFVMGEICPSKEDEFFFSTDIFQRYGTFITGKTL